MPVRTGIFIPDNARYAEVVFVSRSRGFVAATRGRITLIMDALKSNREVRNVGMHLL